MNSQKRLSISITTLIVLCLCLCVSSFALSYTYFEVRNNSFQTGTIDINLNDGKAIITEKDNYLFEPGMTVEKEFFIENKGSWAVYYKVYFSEVSGALGDVLDVTILTKEGEPLLMGKLADLTRENVLTLEDELEVNERKNMIVRFHFPEEAGNDVQGSGLTFELSAVAVQTKNNPQKEFDQ